jgi:predicted hotdog family 3-hydroxylacyl-ACP dehydratase
MIIPDLRALVPHAGPMVLLDRVISADEERLCAEVSIRSDSLFCTADGVGAWIGLEYMAQAVAAYAGYVAYLRGESVKIGFLLGTRRFDCDRPFFSVGTRLQVRVKRIFQSENGMGSFECCIDDGAAEIARATLTVYQPADGAQYADKASA